MSFDQPSGLWLLSLAVPILAFHFYKGRVRRMPVPTLLFWEQVLVEEERRSALRRLRHYASLLLNLAALVVLTSAVAGPTVPGITRAKARYALLLDNSPGMGAVENDGRTRLEHAVDRGRDFLRSLASGDQVSLQDFSGTRHPMTSDAETLARRLGTVKPAAATGVREHVLAALAPGEDVTAILLTDRIPDGVEDLLESGRLRLARVGAARDNVAWVDGLAVRPPGGKAVALSLSVSNFSAAAVEREEVLRWEGRELARRRVALAAGERVAREWTLDPARFPGARIEEGGRAEVVLEPTDALPLDDTASFIVHPLTPPPVVVFHPGKPDPLLMAALETARAGGRIAQEIGAATIDRYPALRGRLGEGWIVIFDRTAPSPLPEAGGVLVLGAPGGSRVEQPTLADWDRDAPPNALIDYSGLAIQRSRILAGGRPLLRAVEGPVATWSAGGGRALVELGFSLSEGDIAARTNFLHLLFNFIDWTAGGGGRTFPAQVRVGEGLRPTEPLWIPEGEILFATAGRMERAEVRGGRLLSPPAAEPGFVRISGPGRSEWTAVNLFDAAESDLRERPPAKPGAPLPPPAPWHARIPYAVLAVSVVLLLLMVEGWLFHRGYI